LMYGIKPATNDLASASFSGRKVKVIPVQDLHVQSNE
jgi:hypothetical protein